MSCCSDKENKNIKNLILTKLSSCKGPMKECKDKKNELQNANKMHRNNRSTSTIHFVQHISPIKLFSDRAVVNVSQKVPRVTYVNFNESRLIG